MQITSKRLSRNVPKFDLLIVNVREHSTKIAMGRGAAGLFRRVAVHHAPFVFHRGHLAIFPTIRAPSPHAKLGMGVPVAVPVFSTHEKCECGLNVHPLQTFLTAHIRALYSFRAQSSPYMMQSRQ